MGILQVFNNKALKISTFRLDDEGLQVTAINPVRFLTCKHKSGGATRRKWDLKSLERVYLPALSLHASHSQVLPSGV